MLLCVPNVKNVKKPPKNLQNRPMTEIAYPLFSCFNQVSIPRACPVLPTPAGSHFLSDLGVFDYGETVGDLKF